MTVLLDHALAVAHTEPAGAVARHRRTRRLRARAVRMVPVRVATPDGRVCGGDTGDSAPVFEIVRPGAFFASPGPRHQGRRRHGRRLAGRDGTDLADLLTSFAARLTTLVPQPRSGCGPWSTRGSRAPREHPRGLSRQHRGALRPEQRPVRGVPRPHHELLVGVVPGGRRPVRAGDLEGAQLRKIDGILDYAGVATGRASWRSARAGGAGHPGGRAWRPG